MLKQWIPWKFLIQRAARSYGIIDPIDLLARMRRFAQPSEVQEPLELLRAGIVFHARGLINTRAIQHNLDWVWPFWVEKQFDPADSSFIPRGFTFSHVNCTHRNWTAVGRPDLPLYPIVDPRGLVTPLHDGWSLDFWIITPDGGKLLPSKLSIVDQHLEFEPRLTVKTISRKQEMRLAVEAALEFRDEIPQLIIRVTGQSLDGGWLIVALRPYNPEGIQFIETVAYDPRQAHWRVNGETTVAFNVTPDQVLFSEYQDGDVIHKVGETQAASQGQCEVGMATAAALFELEKRQNHSLEVRVPLGEELRREGRRPPKQRIDMQTALDVAARLQVPDPRIQFLYDAALRTLVLLSAGEVVPGPYTYRRFWFRDACLMLNAMLAAGLADRSRRHLELFFTHQKYSGYFQSQKGEWDSNGQVLWIMDRFQQLTDQPLPGSWVKALIKGADWIRKKRLSKEKDAAHAGLLPAGFSAEHLGPNDFYYWDDFWGLAGLIAASRLAGKFHSDPARERLKKEADAFRAVIFDSIAAIPEKRRTGGIPASPYRRMDAGAVGSLVADYPLQLVAPGDPRIKRTVAFLMENCLHSGGFFQDMIHSGINPYLTLCVAQTLLRCDDPRFRSLVETVAALASPTGQWPEAIHPHTGGGCMGDGQHGWAAAEWVMMIRNLFIREEGSKLIVGAGIFPEWLGTDADVAYGPSLTPFGPVSVRISRQGDDRLLRVDAHWRRQAPPVEIRIPGFKNEIIGDLTQPWRLTAHAK